MDAGFWFERGTGRKFVDRSPPAESKGEAPLGSGEKPPEAYIDIMALKNIAF